MDEDKKIKHCPNCGDTNIDHKGNEVLCFNCNCIFTITDKGEARVKKLGVLDEIHGRLDSIEQTIFEPDKTDEAGEVKSEAAGGDDGWWGL